IRGGRGRARRRRRRPPIRQPARTREPFPAMNHDSLDTLLVKLNNGEDAAAERVFRDYEPLLRAMVRRRLTPALRAKFDSMDVVQSAWADVLGSYREQGWRFNDRGHLRAFLSRVTINHFFTCCRRHGSELE